MKRMSLILLIALAMVLTMNLFAQDPKPMLQEVYDVGGSWPDNVIYPEDGSIELTRAYFLARPGDIQLGPSPLFTAGMDGGRFLLQFNLGNFGSGWTAGEILRIEAYQAVTGNIAVTEFPVAAGTSPQARFDEFAMVLQLPPAVLFDSNVPAEYTVVGLNNQLFSGYPQWVGDSYVYRHNYWTFVATVNQDNGSWNASFSTEGVIGDLQVTSKLRRAFYMDDDTLEDVWGPRTFRTYYSIDNGATWVWYPAVTVNLPNDETWVPIEFELPEALYGQPNVQLRWLLAAYSATSSTIISNPEESWGEIKDVVVTGMMEEVIPTEYALTIEVVGEGTTVPAPGVYMYEEGTIVPLMAVETTMDWYFQYWMIDGMEVYDMAAEVLMDADKTVVAHFAYEPPPLNPPVVSNPTPAHEAIDVPIDTPIGWNITVGPEYWVPSEVQVNMWEGDMLGDPFVGIVPVQPDGNYYFVDHPFGPFAYETDYFWQVVPIEPVTRSATTQRTRADRESRNREWPVWTFTTEIEIVDVYYTLDISVVGNGTTVPAPGVYVEAYLDGSIVNISAIPAAMWQFDYWMINGVQVVDNPYDLLMDEDKVVVAHFSEIPRPPGSTCDNPYIANLPIVNYQDDTALYGDDYSNTWIDPPSSYLNGNDFVVQFDMPEAGNLFGTLQAVTGNWIGLFILDQCPDPVTPAPVLGLATSSGTLATLAPTLLPAGTYFAIVSTWPSPQTFEFILNLDYEPLPEDPEFAINPTSWNYGMVQVEYTSVKAFTITNIAGGNLIINSGDIWIEGDPAFTLLPIVYPINLEGGESAIIEVQFAPMVVGPYSAILKIEDNIAGRNTRDRAVNEVPLTGEGFDPVLYPPILEPFTGTFPPMNWARYAGLLTDNSVLNPVTGFWTHGRFGYIGTVNNSARINIYGTRNHWLVTPPIQLGDGGYQVEFDIALTLWNSATQGAFGVDDYVAFVVSLDNGVTWSDANVLASWAFGDEVPNTGLSVVLDTAGLTGMVKFGIYAERPTGTTPDIDFYFTNFQVRVPPVQAEFFYTPEFLAFGELQVGLASAVQNVTISNIGAGEIVIAPGDVMIGGANADQFYLVPITEDIVLVPGVPYNIGVQFTPSVVGLQEAYLEINDNLSRAIHQIALSGTGVDFTIYPPWSEDFTGVAVGTIPGGWTRNHNNWSVQNTVNAGGEAPELRFMYTSGIGTYRVVTPPIAAPVIRQTEWRLDFKHMVNHYGLGYELAVQSSPDGENWTTLWSIEPTAGVPAQTVTLTIDHLIGDTFFLSWALIGDPYQINYWYVDDIEIYEHDLGAPPVFAIYPDAWDYGIALVDDFAVKQFIISNLGGSEIVINDGDIWIDGDAAFALGTIVYPIILGEAASYGFDVIFAPLAEGNYAATLKVEDNIGGRNVRVTRANDRNSANRAVNEVPLTGEGFLWVDPELVYQWFDQPYFDGGTAATSAYDPDAGVDYEVADNFWGVEGSIDVIEFYGLSLKFDGAWMQVPPSPIENFIVRFYEYETEAGDALYAQTTGTYSVALVDDFGDGWNGGLLDVYVNDTLVLEDITLLSGAGPLYFDFDVVAGDNIWTVYTAGGWAYENYYAIFDDSDVLIAEDGGTWANPGASTPTGIPQAGDLVALEPNWASPVIGPLYEIAHVEQVGTVWGGAFNLYKYTIEFATPIAMEEGWISLQINTAAGSSGAWFLWINSVAGDMLAHQRTGTRADLAEIMFTRDRNIENRAGRAALAYDLAFTLWGPEALTYYTLAVDIAEGEGTIQLDGSPIVVPYLDYFMEGTPVELLATNTEQYWYFDYWVVDGVVYTDNPLPLIIDGNIEVLAYYYYEEAQPVVLSSFTASITANLFVQLQWITESENSLLGYHVYRANDDVLADAEMINPQIINATNTSSTVEYSFVDENVLIDATYYYWLQYVDYDLTGGFHGPITVTVTDEEITPPVELFTRLQQNYPNPFNPDTIIKFSLAEDVRNMEIKVYNLLGQEVRTLVSGPHVMGEYQVIWDGKDNSGKTMSSGIYFYRMTTPDYIKVHKMMLLK